MAEPTVQVPVSVVKLAAHYLGRGGFRYLAGRLQDALLSQPTPTAEADHAPTAPLSIADMVPGTTFTARYRLMGAVEDRFTVMPGPPNLWLRGDQYEVGLISDIDPSTIRDVTPPAATS